MKLIPEMQHIKDRVTKLLVQYPHLRSSDNKLIASIWKTDVKRMGQDVNEINAMTFLQLYATEQITNSETIRRVRQKIQEEQPELQGPARKSRKEQAEEVRKNINDQNLFNETN